MIRFFACLLVVILSGVAVHAEPDFPNLTGRVVDQAGILPADIEASLVTLSEQHEVATTDQLVIATITSLEGYEIADYANRLFRKWQLGQKDKNNGVLLLVAPNERKVRIEVGYGLEGTLTDAIARYIIDKAILPQFRAGDIPLGIQRGANDIVKVLAGDAKAFEKRMELEDTAGDFLGTIFFIIWCLLFFGIAGVGILTRIFGTRTKDGRYKWGPITTSGASSSSRRSGGRSSGGFSGGGGSSGGGGASGGW